MSEVPFDLMRFVTLADELASGTNDEARLRTAISRLYYGVFLLARQRAGIDERRFVHERVRTALSSTNSRLAASLGVVGRLRDVADYEELPGNLHERDWSRNWQRARRNAEIVLTELRTLP